MNYESYSSGGIQNISKRMSMKEQNDSLNDEQQFHELPSQTLFLEEIVEQCKSQNFFRQIYQNSLSKEKKCRICSKDFGFFQSQSFCPLCGEYTCTECLQYRRPDFTQADSKQLIICKACHEKEVDQFIEIQYNMKEKKLDLIIDHLQSNISFLKMEQDTLYNKTYKLKKQNLEDELLIQSQERDLKYKQIKQQQKHLDLIEEINELDVNKKTTQVRLQEIEQQIEFLKVEFAEKKKNQNLEQVENEIHQYNGYIRKAQETLFQMNENSISKIDSKSIKVKRNNQKENLENSNLASDVGNYNDILSHSGMDSLKQSSYSPKRRGLLKQ